MKEDKIYQIFIVEKDTVEFYTFNQPTLKDGKVVCKNLLQKGKVMEEIMGERLEEYYKIQCGDLSTTLEEYIDSFELKDGIAIKLLSIESEVFSWLDKTKEQAQNLLKDKVLNFYQLTVPKLIQGMEQLQIQIKMLNTGSPHAPNQHVVRQTGNPQQQRKNDLLIP